MPFPRPTDWGIDNTHIDTFSANVNRLAQQTSYLFSGKIREDNKQGEVSWHDTIKPRTHNIITVRGAVTPLVESEWFRRGVSATGYDNAAPLFIEDAIRQLIEPRSPITQEMVNSRMRLKNQSVIDAALGSAMQKSQGHKGAISFVPLPSGNKIAVDYGTPGTNTGLTTGKLRALRKKFLDLDDPRFTQGTETLYLLCSPDALMRFLEWAEKNSTSNVLSVRELIDGKINRWMGFEWILTGQIPAVADVRPMIAFAKDGLLHNTWKTMTRADWRPDLSYTWQAYDRIDHGAVRLNDQLVHIAYNDESV